MINERKCKECGTEDISKFYTSSKMTKSLCKECYNRSRRKITASDKTTLEITAVEAIVIAIDNTRTILTIRDDYDTLWSALFSRESVENSIKRLESITELTEVLLDSNGVAIKKKNDQPTIVDVRYIFKLRRDTRIMRGELITNDR